MEYGKLTQGVKELRKRKGYSQEDLAKNSGLSLRTIQRVENGETEPTGETLKRISNVFETTPLELMNWESNKETLRDTVKTKHEYLHIFDHKLIISKTTEFDNLVEDYGKSVNNVFKTLMVFFISIPTFSILAVVFINLGNTGLALYAGAFAFCFLVVAFYSILFTSGASLIKKENITKVTIKRNFFNNVVLISHKESGRLKDRSLILEKDQMEIMKKVLLSENLLEEKDIKVKGKIVNFQKFFIALFSIAPFFLLLIIEELDMAFYYIGAIVISFSVILMIKMILRFTVPLFNKPTIR